MVKKDDGMKGTVWQLRGFTLNRNKPRDYVGHLYIEGNCNYRFSKLGKYLKYEEGYEDREGNFVRTGRIMTKKNIYYKVRIPSYCNGEVSFACLGKKGAMCRLFEFRQADPTDLLPYIKALLKARKIKKQLELKSQKVSAQL